MTGLAIRRQLILVFLAIALLVPGLVGSAAGDEAATGAAQPVVIQRDQVVLHPVGGARFDVLRLVRVQLAVDAERLELDLPLSPDAERLQLMQGFADGGWSGSAGDGVLKAAGPATAAGTKDFVYTYEAALETVRDRQVDDWVAGPPSFLWHAAYAYPVVGLQVLTPQGMFGATWQEEALEAVGPVEVAGLTLDIWQLTGLQSRTVTIALDPARPGQVGGGDGAGGSLAGLSSASNPLAQLGQAWEYLAAVGAALSFALLWAVLRQRQQGGGLRQQVPAAPAGAASGPASGARRELVARIADLDLQLAAGGLDADEHRRRRAELVTRVHQPEGRLAPRPDDHGLQQAVKAQPRGQGTGERRA